jgi:hypothetical protein
MFFFIMLTEIVIFWRMTRRAVFLPFPHGLMLYFIMSQFAFNEVVKGNLESDFLYTWSSMAFYGNSDKIQLLFFGLFLWAASLGVGVHLEKKPRTDGHVTIPTIAVFATVIFIYAYHVLHVSQFQDGLLWFTSEYLLMKSPDALKPSWFAAPLASAFAPMGMLAILSATVFWMANHKWGTLALIPSIAWAFLVELAAHSRTSAMYLFGAAFLVRIASPKRSTAFSIGLIIVGYFTVLSVLGGRVSFQHGLSSLGSYAENVSIAYERIGFLGPLLNLTEGIFTTAEIFSREATFNVTYKILSFSPLPSFIDGFDRIRDSSMVRLHEYVPMGALQEVYLFGGWYMIMYFVIVSFAARVNLRQMCRSMSLGGMFNNIIIAGAWYIGLAYPCRNALRFQVISIIVTIIIEIHLSMKDSGKSGRQMLQAKTGFLSDPLRPG